MVTILPAEDRTGGAGFGAGLAKGVSSGIDQFLTRRREQQEDQAAQNLIAGLKPGFTGEDLVNAFKDSNISRGAQKRVYENVVGANKINEMQADIADKKARPGLEKAKIDANVKRFEQMAEVQKQLAAIKQQHEDTIKQLGEYKLSIEDKKVDANIEKINSDIGIAQSDLGLRQIKQQQDALNSSEKLRIEQMNLELKSAKNAAEVQSIKDKGEIAKLENDLKLARLNLDQNKLQQQKDEYQRSQDELERKNLADEDLKTRKQTEEERAHLANEGIDLKRIDQNVSKGSKGKLENLQGALRRVEAMEDIRSKGNLGRFSGAKTEYAGGLFTETAEDYGASQKLGASLISFASSIIIRNQREFEALSRGLLDPTLSDAQAKGILREMKGIIQDSIKEYEAGGGQEKPKKRPLSDFERH